MSDCMKYEELISGYVDGELTETEKAELLEHIKTCPSCAALLEIYESMADQTDDMLAEPPDELAAGVMDEVRELAEKNKRAGRKRFWTVGTRYLAAAACIALILYVAPSVPGIGCGNSESTAPMMSEETAESAAPVQANGADADAAPSEGSMDGYKKADGSAADTAALMPSSAPASMEMPAEAANEEADGAVTGMDGMYAEIHVSGELPDILKGYSMLRSDEGGTYRIMIPAEVADELAQLGYEVEIINESGTEAVVIYRR